MNYYCFLIVESSWPNFHSTSTDFFSLSLSPYLILTHMLFFTTWSPARMHINKLLCSIMSNLFTNYTIKVGWLATLWMHRNNSEWEWMREAAVAVRERVNGRISKIIGKSFSTQEKKKRKIKQRARSKVKVCKHTVVIKLNLRPFVKCGWTIDMQVAGCISLSFIRHWMACCIVQCWVNSP